MYRVTELEHRRSEISVITTLCICASGVKLSFCVCVSVCQCVCQSLTFSAVTASPAILGACGVSTLLGSSQLMALLI